MSILISDTNIYISILYRTIYRYYMEYKESTFQEDVYTDIIKNIVNKLK